MNKQSRINYECERPFSLLVFSFLNHSKSWKKKQFGVMNSTSKKEEAFQGNPETGCSGEEKERNTDC